MTGFDHIGVVGAGAWGVALAQSAAAGGRRVTLWGRDSEDMRNWRDQRAGARLPNVRLADEVAPTSDFTDLAGCDALLIATPAQTTRRVAEAISATLMTPCALVLCAKGIEAGTHAFLTDVLARSRAGFSARRALRPELRGRCRGGPADRRDARRGDGRTRRARWRML